MMRTRGLAGCKQKKASNLSAEDFHKQFTNVGKERFELPFSPVKKPGRDTRLRYIPRELVLSISF
jgi:hypothetical protein